MAEWVVLAGIRRARGIRGEVSAESNGSPAERFQPGLQVWLVRGTAVRPVEIESARPQDGSIVLKFRGLDTRNEAEELRGADICIPLEERPPAPEGEFYFSDLVGCQLETPDGRRLGVVVAWHEFGAAPVLQVIDGKRELLVPFAEAYYRTVDVAGRRIVMELPEGLEELYSK